MNFLIAYETHLHPAPRALHSLALSLVQSAPGPLNSFGLIRLPRIRVARRGLRLRFAAIKTSFFYCLLLFYLHFGAAAAAPLQCTFLV